MSFVLLQKNGDAITKKVKGLTPHTLYKKCGFRTDTDFERRYIWSVKVPELYLIAVYGKTKGRSDQVNKSELPPPLDTTMFYGGIGLVRLDKTGTIEPFTKEEWEKIYEALYGGFENLDNTSEGTDEIAPEDDETNYDKTELTNSGYLKDGFIVSDEDDEHEYTKDYVSSKKHKRVPKKKTIQPVQKDMNEVKELEEDDDDEDHEDDDEDEEEDDEDEDDDDEETTTKDEDEEVVFEDEYTDSELSEDAFTDDE